MNYFCPKCNFTWNHPIGICPYCFSSLKKRESRKIKVIGISKVFIPTIFHQKIPYYVLLLEDENKNRWVLKSAKKYRLGEKFSLEKAKTKEAVGIWRVKYNYLEPISILARLLNLKLKKNLKTFILPNLTASQRPHLGFNVHPQFLLAMIDFLKEKGIKEIKVGTQSFDEVSLEEKGIKSGLFKVLKEKKISFLDLSREKFKNFGKMRISQIFFDFDFIINLPILKIGTLSSIENLSFLFKKEDLSKLKEEDIFEILKSILKEGKIFTFAQGDSIQNEKKFIIFPYLLLASFNPLFLERVFYEILSRPLPKLLKKVKIESIPIVGRKIEEVEFLL